MPAPAKAANSIANDTCDRRNFVLPLLLAAGFAVRALSPLLYPNFAHPDEVYQNVEQAYWQLTGHGLLTWEYYYGIRSALFPMFLAWVIKLCWVLGLSTPSAYLALRLSMDAISLPIIACAFVWGRRTGLPGADLLSGLLVCLWPDPVYFSSHPLTEVAAAAFLIPGICLAESTPGHALKKSGVFAAALLLSAASVLRFQYGPAALAVWGILAWRDRRTGLPAAVLGGLIPVLAGGLSDWISLGRPFQSIWLNFIVNWNYGASSAYGTSSWYAFFGKFALMWDGAFAFILALAAIGALRSRLVALAAVVLLATHMIVPHKEYRFLYAMVPLVLTLAGIGTARAIEIVSEWSARQPAPQRFAGKNTSIGIAGCVWLISAACLYLNQETLFLFRKNTGAVATQFDLARRPNVCGIAEWNISKYMLAGEFGFGHRVTVFYPATKAEFLSRQRGFNAVVYQPGKSGMPSARNWTKLGCRPVNGPLPALLTIVPETGEVCLATRPGPCSTVPPLATPLDIPPEMAGKPFPWLAHPLPLQSRMAAGNPILTPIVNH